MHYRRQVTDGMAELHNNKSLPDTIEAGKRFSIATKQNVAVVEFKGRDFLPTTYEIVSEEYLTNNPNAKIKKHIKFHS